MKWTCLLINIMFYILLYKPSFNFLKTLNTIIGIIQWNCLKWLSFSFIYMDGRLKPKPKPTRNKPVAQTVKSIERDIREEVENKLYKNTNDAVNIILVMSHLILVSCTIILYLNQRNRKLLVIQRFMYSVIPVCSL